jgi:hypothetical protein
MTPVLMLAPEMVTAVPTFNCLLTRRKRSNKVNEINTGVFQKSRGFFDTPLIGIAGAALGRFFSM